MSACDLSPLFIRCGTTWDQRFLYRDCDTQQPVIIDDLHARGSFRDADGNVVLTVDTADSTLLIPVGEGRVVGNLDSTQTPSLSPDNVRRELKLYIELYDDSSPEIIEQFVEIDVVVLPDLTT